MVTVIMEEWQLVALRNYFGTNDKTTLEHWAYELFNDELNQLKDIKERGVKITNIDKTE